MSRLDDETLQRFFDGDLPEDERVQVEAQIAEDREAEQKLAGLALTGDLVRGHLTARAAEAPLDGLWERVQAALSTEEASTGPAGAGACAEAAQPRSAWTRFRAWLGASMGAHPLRWAGAGALAVVVAAVLAVLLAGRSRGPALPKTRPEVAQPAGRVIIQDLDAPDRHPDVYEIRDGKRTTTVIWIHDDGLEEDGSPEDAPPARRDDI